MENLLFDFVLENNHLSSMEIGRKISEQFSVEDIYKYSYYSFAFEEDTVVRFDLHSKTDIARLSTSVSLEEARNKFIEEAKYTTIVRASEARTSVEYGELSNCEEVLSYIFNNLLKEDIENYLYQPEELSDIERYADELAFDYVIEEIKAIEEEEEKSKMIKISRSIRYYDEFFEDLDEEQEVEEVSFSNADRIFYKEAFIDEKKKSKEKIKNTIEEMKKQRKTDLEFEELRRQEIVEKFNNICKDWNKKKQ